MTEENRGLTISRIFQAPRDLVFRMWTDPAHLANWWGPYGFRVTIHKMEPRPGGEWDFIMHGPDGKDYKNHIVYSEVSPSRIVYQHDSHPPFQATITFEDASDSCTKVTMRMLFPTPADREQTVKVFRADEGQKQTMQRLADEIARQDHKAEFVVKRVVDAPRELVFQAWTDPAHLAKWWGPKGCEIQIRKHELHPGGVFHYRMSFPGGHSMWGKFAYREIVPPSRLAFVSSFSDDSEDLTRHPMSATWPMETLTTIEFKEESPRQTCVTLRAVPLDASPVERETFFNGHGSMQQGFGGTFDQLALYLSGDL